MKKGKNHSYDKSYDLFSKYIELVNHWVEIKLKNGQVVIGILTGFYKGDPELNEPYIVQWQLVNENDSQTGGADLFGFRIGKLVVQTEISEIKFLTDNSVMKFK